MTPKEMITVEKEVYEAVLRNSVRVIDLEAENQQLKELLKQWVHFYPIVLYEYEDTLKTRDIIELFEKTINAIGEKK